MVMPAPTGRVATLDAMPASDESGATPSVEQQLDELQRASEERRAELREIAAQLPEALSRRTILRKIAGDIRHAPEKRDIAGRAARKAGRTIRQIGRSFERLVTRSRR
jgi:hypothetical protein